ncbi:MAG: hypothetical protein AABW59_02940 [archaeon]
MKIALIGAGDIELHYTKFLGISQGALAKHISSISNAISDSKSDVVVLPDRGISFEVAKQAKSLGNIKVFGTVPLADKTFGTAHLQPFINAKVGEKKVIDEIIDTGDWFRQDLTHCTFGDVILLLGVSTGSMGELAYGYYLYKLFGGHRKEVESKKKNIHEQIVAGDKMPFDTIVYLPLVKEKLPFEIEKYIVQYGAKVHYVNDAKELAALLSSLKK